MALFNMSKSYNFADVQLTIAGQRIGGFAEDGSINLEWASEENEMVQGADGEVTIVQHPKPPATMTVTLLQSSVSNAILQAIYEAQRLSGSAIAPVAVVDAATGYGLISAEAKIVGKPNVQWGRGIGATEWKFLLPYPEAALGTPPLVLPSIP